jgi:hypothetical protein
LGLLRVEATGAPSTPLVTEDGQAVTVLGRVIDDPEATGRRVKLRIAVESVDRGEGWEPLRTRALAYAEPPESLLLQREPPYFRYGDRLRLEGVLERPLPIARLRLSVVPGQPGYLRHPRGPRNDAGLPGSWEPLARLDI